MGLRGSIDRAPGSERRASTTVSPMPKMGRASRARWVPGEVPPGEGGALGSIAARRTPPYRREATEMGAWTVEGTGVDSGRVRMDRDHRSARRKCRSRGGGRLRLSDGGHCGRALDPVRRQLRGRLSPLGLAASSLERRTVVAVR